MLAKWLIIFIMISPVALYATQENDMELFEFLAMYDENDNVFIDAEIDDNENLSEQNLTSQKVSKSDADE
ncbi:MAG: hypothetical protein KAT06_00505 [Gammaproteobacteria bacterium]|nr:hypothetical protein [Gammaproteobacteria bacterium]